MVLPRPALLLGVLATGLLAAGCDLADDGPRTTRTRDLAPFTRVDNRDSVDVRLHVGEPQRVRVRAGSKVIGDVGTEVHDGTLRLTFDHGGLLGDDVVVEAWVPRLDAVEASGSGDVDADGIEADAFAVRSEGSADVDLEGIAGRLAVTVDGSGDVRLADLEAREAEVDSDGSGDVEVRAGDRLAVKVDGSGDVRYHGDPAVTRHGDGSGEVSQAD